jgi:hypothetical protein
VQVKATANDGSGIEGKLEISISNQFIAVTEIIVSGEAGKDSITKDDGVLQMIATIFPAHASNPEVIWSAENITGDAFINQDGELKAVANGPVLVKAHSTDGSNTYGSCVVFILNQSDSPDIFDSNDYAVYTIQQRDILTIYYLNTDFIGKTCTIYTLPGVLKYKQQITSDITEINVSSYSAGIYIIKISDKKTSISLKTMIR